MTDFKHKNVSMDGNYNIQVISRALMQFNELSCTPMFQKENDTSNLSGEQGFVCHNGDHWLAIRKVNGVWYNLNSTNMVPPGA